MTELIQKLSRDRRLTTTEYETLLGNRTPVVRQELRRLADLDRRNHYGTTVYIRGAMEISTICQNNCLYCSQRRSNTACQRYRLRAREVLDIFEEGYGLGLRSFILRGGEDPFYNDQMLESMIQRLKDRFPDCALTLALGERSHESYQRLFNAGADRYLMRHEAADRQLYESLHPKQMSWDHRMHCLNVLKEIGYQVGCGFIVGLPGQTLTHLARDLTYIQEFQPHMVDVGPFVPQDGTPFAEEPPGDPQLTDDLVSIIRILCPGALITAPGEPEALVLAGANVVCWPLYPAQPCMDALSAIQRRLADIGFEGSTARGDCITTNA